MKNKLKLFYVSSEVAPFAKTDTRAEISRALPKSLKDLGLEVRVMMPNYRVVNERKYILRDVIRLKDLAVKIGEKEVLVSAKSAFIPDSKVQIYFLDNKEYFGRDGLYADPETGLDYPDNDERFILFCKGCIETLRMLHWQPDIIHCIDWQTALIPLYLKTLLANDEFFKNTKIVFSIHNLASQGNFSVASVAKAGLPTDMFFPNSDIEFYDQFSFLKSALTTSDMLIVGGETYTRQLLSDAELAAGMEGVLKVRAARLHGVASGVDSAIWNPELDQHIFAQYSAKDLDAKEENKKALLEKLQKPYRIGTPLVAVVLKSGQQNGFDLVTAAIADVLAKGASILLMGNKNAYDQKSVQSFAEKYPTQFITQLPADEVSYRQLFAASDMVLLPARHQAAGVDQLYCMRYGAVPIVYAHEENTDTVQHFDIETEEGTGFVFTRFEKEAMLDRILLALKTYQDGKKWQKLVRNAMKQDFSWENVAQKFARLYTKLTTNKK